MRQLQAEGAQLEVLGRVEGSYKDHELYRVRIPDGLLDNGRLQP